MNKLKFILTACLAAALTLSCSQEDDESGDSSSSGGGNSSGEVSSSSGGAPGSFITTEGPFDLVVDAFAGDFTYTNVYPDGMCSEGIYTEEPYSFNTVIRYQIENKTLTWDYSNYGEEIYFNGQSNELFGTWTRTPNRDVDCSDEFGCKFDWDITKAEIANNTIKISRYNCPMQYWRTGEEWNYDWTVEVVDCNTLKISSGSDKVTYKVTKNGYEYTYGGKTCKYKNLSSFSFAEKKAACAEAWENFGEDSDDFDWDYAEDYDYVLNYSYYECIQDIPESFFEESDCYDCGYKIAAKSAGKVNKSKAKAKLPLLKKIK